MKNRHDVVMDATGQTAAATDAEAHLGILDYLGLRLNVPLAIRTLYFQRCFGVKICSLHLHSEFSMF